MSNSLWPHGLERTRPPWSSPTPGVCPSSCRLNLVIPSSHLMPLSSSSPSAFDIPQHQGLFRGVRSLHQVPKYWSFSFCISPSSRYSGLISFRIDWFDCLAVKGTLKSLLYHHNLKVPVLQCSVFFMVWLSHQYITTGKTIALTLQTFIRAEIVRVGPNSVWLVS